MWSLFIEEYLTEPPAEGTFTATNNNNKHPEMFTVAALQFA